MLATRMRGSAPALILLILPLLLIAPALLAGDDFAPSGLLSRFAPWSSGLPSRVGGVWNPLLYDAIGQFLPWRLFAARSLQSGYLPLWNPFQFCGTPFLANSQSAVLYPPNLLYLVLRPGLAAGLLAWLHLWVAGLGAYLLARRLGMRMSSGVVAGIAWQLSGWQVSWLLLPTFLNTSCWLGFLLLGVLSVHSSPTARNLLGLSVAVALTLLAGHLQIAFYCLGTSSLLIGYSLLRQRGATWRAALVCVAAIVIGALGALPQVLPALELASWSHRSGKPTAAGYGAYTAYSVHPASLVTLVDPAVRGLPADPQQPYRGTSHGGQYFNYAEGAMFLGIPALLLALLGATAMGRDRRVRLLVVMAAGCLLVACGTAVDAVLYYMVPGFGGSGSPGRILVLVAFSSALLAGYGVEHATSRPLRLTLGVAVGVVLAGLGLEWYAAYSWQPAFAAGPPEPAVRHWLLGMLLLGLLVAGRLQTRYAGWVGSGAAGLCAAGLLLHGVGLNPTAPAAWTYPDVPGLAELRRQVGHDRVAVGNRNWSFAGPDAAFPPNGGMVAMIRDAQGYDSLFPGQYKRYLLDATGQDPSPPEVGNMVLLKDPVSVAERLGAVLAVTGRDGGLDTSVVTGARGRVFALPPSDVRWREDRGTRVRVTTAGAGPGSLVLRDQYVPGWRAFVDGHPAALRRYDTVFRLVEVPAGTHTVTFRYLPAAFLVGLFALCLVSAGAVGWLAFTVAGRRGRRS